MKKVLAVDDSRVVRAMASRYLEPFGCEVLEAGDGREGVAAACSYRPDLVLLDVTMPVMDGRQALIAIRTDPNTPAIPVILLATASAREGAAEMAALGVAGCIAKPFERRGFSREVSRVLGPPGVPPRRPVDRTAVLVVDADQAWLDALRVALAGSMTVLTAFSRAEAATQYGRVRPGVVVVDLAMPEMDGFRTLTQLQELGTSGFLAFVERGDASQREWARQVGCHGVLEKPVDPQALAEQVRRAAAAVATAEEVLSIRLVEEGRCATLQLPDPRSAVFATVLPVLRRTLYALVEAGRELLIIDLADLAQTGADVAGAVLRLVGDADRIGFRTAVCARPGPLAEHLGQLLQTQNRLYPSRQAAREAFQ